MKQHKKSARKKNKNMTWFIAAMIAIAVILSLIPFLKNKEAPSSEKQQQESVEAAPSADRVLAEVNGEKIMKNELMQTLQRVRRIYGVQVNEEVLLNQTIARLLLLQEAEKQGFNVSDEEVEQAVENLRKQVPPGQSLEAILEAQGLDLEKAKKEIRDQKLLDKFLRTIITDEEVEKYYNENIDEFSAKEGEIRARQILVKTEQEAEEIRQKLLEGADFGELAKNFSLSGDKAVGGELGFFNRSAMVANFSDAAFALDIGEISLPVKTKYGYHIIQREEGVLPLELVKDGIRRRLLSQRLPSYIAELKAKADIKIYSEEEAAATQPAEEQAQAEQVQEEQPTQEAEARPAQAQEEQASAPEITSFSDTGKEICTEEGKPVIRLFSTTVCPHCNWIKDTFDSVASEYMDKGLIVAHHYQLNTGDDELTPEKESYVPQSERELYREMNPDSTVPTFVFGCKYLRIGNAYEKDENGLAKEEAEFRAVIDKLLAEAGQ